MTIQRFEHRSIPWIRQRGLQLREQHGPKLRIRFKQFHDSSPELSLLGPQLFFYRRRAFCQRGAALLKFRGFCLCPLRLVSVSYTHLDVYKRQTQ